MKSVSVNLVDFFRSLFCSEIKEEGIKSKKNIKKGTHRTISKHYHDIYEDLTLEQQLIINKMRIGA